MPLATQVSTLATRIGTEFKNVRASIGALGSLTTSDKTTIVAAINEVKASVSAVTGAVSSVAGRTGAVVLSKSDVGLANVDNTSDTSKPVSTAQQTALNLKADSSSLSALALSGNASDLIGTLGTAQLPPLAINETFAPATQAAMLALTAQRGDIAIRQDNGKTYVLATDSPGTLADWKQITAVGDVVSVAGRTGAVVLTKTDVGLANLDNTSDVNKPVSTAQQTAINGRQPLDTDLTAIAALASAANKLAYATGSGTWALADFTAAGRTLVAGADAAAQRSSLSVYSQTEIGNPETDFVAVFEAALV